MELARSLLQIITEKFPQQAEQIEKLFSADEDFRALCSDYVLCLKYVRKFKKESEEKKLSVKEYNNVRSELENELSKFIANTQVG